MQKILVYRFSALGDVAMLLPVFRGILATNSDVEIYFVTRSFFFPLFRNINRLYLIEADLNNTHKGIVGLKKLFSYCKRTINPDFVIDLHSVLRTRILDALFLLSGINIVRIEKGRKEKKSAIKEKHLLPLHSSFERYKKPFLKLGFSYSEPVFPLFSFHDDLKFEVKEKLAALQFNPIKIGIAPFAKHSPKIWGLNKIDQIISKLISNIKCSIFLFGGGDDEINQLSILATKYENCIVVNNHFNFEQELLLISHLSTMVCMDSANMHLASLAGIPTISIWGGTHPSIGFAPYNQPSENNVQYNGSELTCRPCSVYGNKKCIYSTIRCMELVTTNQVYKRVEEVINGLKIQNPAL